jgi:rSAM/selenodomain-associated transferase 2
MLPAVSAAFSAADRIAIVVPTLDEEATLRATLENAVPHCGELIVADGGSSDRTVEIAERCGARVVRGPAGRGAQLNAGARAATLPVLLFVHADTALPAGAAAAVCRGIDAGAVGGGFRVRFDSPRRSMRLGERLVNLRTRALRLPLGDQAQFATHAAFAAVGGFREWPILEDLDFIRRLKRHGRLAVAPLAVSTDARRFHRRGIARTVATNWLIWGLFFAGVSPLRLARLYRHVR